MLRGQSMKHEPKLALDGDLNWRLRGTAHLLSLAQIDSEELQP